MDVLVTLVVVLVVTTALWGLGLWLLLRALAVRNRVVAGVRSPAPLTWLVSMRFEAVLHRRLRRASMGARAAVAGAPDHLGLGGLVASLAERAGQLDTQLVVASRAPRGARRRLLHELGSEAAELEQLVERVIRMSRPSGRAALASLDSVRERLELLEAALSELDGADARWTAAPAGGSGFRRPA